MKTLKLIYGGSYFSSLSSVVFFFVADICWCVGGQLEKSTNNLLVFF